MKRLLLIALGSLSLNMLGGCFQPVDGMNLWRMTAEVGSCVDVYGESILDELDQILCAVGSVVPLTQANFAAPYIITTPGYYKICENITALASLTINSDDVVLDLGSRFLDGIGISIGNGFRNITIKNGLMRNVPQFIDIAPFTQNILIENIVFEDATAAVITFGIRIADGPVTGLTIRDILFYNAPPQAIVLAGFGSNILSNIVLENIRCISTNQALTATPGVDATIHLFDCEVVEVRNVVVTDPFQGLDCILLDTCDDVLLDTISITSSLASGGTASGVRLDACNNVEHSQVSVFGEAFDIGFNVTTGAGSQNILYNDCSALGVNGTGFILTTGTDITYSHCVATGTVTGNGMTIIQVGGLSIDDCETNENDGTGLQISNCGRVALQAHRASLNQAAGIALSGGLGSSIKECFLTQNQTNGLKISATGDLTIEGIFTSLNVQDGLLISNSGSITAADLSSIDNGGNGITMSGVSLIAIQGFSIQKNDVIGLSVISSNQVTINDGMIFENSNDGIKCDTISNLTLSGCDVKHNGSRGISILSSNQVIIKDCSILKSAATGLICDVVDNLVISGCEAQKNGFDGFFIRGANGGNIPTAGDPEDTTGRSPLFVENCSSFQNGVTSSSDGFYFTNVGGVLVRDSFASYNNGYGFHFDSGSWNVQVAGCYATSNALIGFITWDSPVPATSFSLYNNRFRDCYASHNNTNFVYNPFSALSDFATSNTPGAALFPPIGAAFNAQTLTSPIVVVDIVPANFCGYQ